MLNGLTSPHNELRSLLAWRALPETQEVLKHLTDKSKTADQEANRSPVTYPRGSDGTFLMEMSMIRCLQDRYRGAATGFQELERLLDEREAELREAIRQEEEAQRPQQPEITENV